MAEKMPQTFENHTRFVPLYHFVAGPIFLINLLWAVYRLIAAFSLESVIGTAIALALVFLLFGCLRSVPRTELFASKSGCECRVCLRMT